jgi:hypothetical protein
MIACAAISIDDAPNGKVASKLKIEFQIRIETTPITTLAETKYRDRDFRSSLLVPKRIGANKIGTPNRPPIVPQESNTKGAKIVPKELTLKVSRICPVPRKKVDRFRTTKKTNPTITISKDVPSKKDRICWLNEILVFCFLNIRTDGR